MKIMIRLSLLICVALLLSCGMRPTQWSVQSPDGRLEIQIDLRAAAGDTHQPGMLSYQVVYHGDDVRTVIESSPLGIQRADQTFYTHLNYAGQSERMLNQSYTLITGKQLQHEVECRELTLELVNDQTAPVNVVFRAYNDGIAYKYVFPEQSDSLYTVEREWSSFNLPNEGRAWLQPYDTLGVWSPAYEYGYIKDLSIGDPPPLSTGWGFPALFEADSLWVLLSETNLDSGYCGAHLSAEAPDGLYRIEFPHDWEAYGMWDRTPSSTLPWETPWRLAVIGDDLGTVVESNLVTHLADESVLENTDWIEPGKASWSWWGDHSSGRNYDKLKEYVDLAADMGWTYSLVDADWHIMEGGTIEELVEYANSRDVGILLWYNSGGPHTRVMNAGPRDLMYDRKIRRREMQKISDWGVKGIKVDFFQSDKQQVIDLYIDIFKDAADFNLVVNTHGCTIPRGWHRTYPNALSMESVRGAELYSYPPYAERAVWLNSVYPFTRNVIGPMDYTPVTFSDYSPETPHVTSYAHELALSVVFQCGIQHIADRIAGLQKVPQEVRGFLKQVPVSWDDTRFVDGYPGRSVVLARLKDGVYYLAGINGEFNEKSMSLDLDFLDDQEYKLNLFTDGMNKRSFGSINERVTRDSQITVTLLSAGGFAGTLTPVE
ncbi:MAG: glycoside hydrolase family 97 catalytic domain-containing protein [candidate division KSB1 bacterium]|nr:glycoside hydrolase family 97 catalytic domain-containing protein [candidate division KSB1 bacterium]